MSTRTTEYLQSLVRELSKMNSETEWVEFKCNNKDPERIAKYISGLSNSATLWEKPKGYLVWGIDNDTHEIVGTDFDYRNMKKGNEELEAWLSRMMNPRINFKFYEVSMDDNFKVILAEIPCAENEPTKYQSNAYIRVGTNLKPLMEYQEKEAELWRMFDNTLYELRIASSNKTEDETVMLLNYSEYYDKLELPIPRSRDKVLEDLQNEKFFQLEKQPGNRRIGEKKPRAGQASPRAASKQKPQGLWPCGKRRIIGPNTYAPIPAAVRPGRSSGSACGHYCDW